MDRTDIIVYIAILISVMSLMFNVGCFMYGVISSHRIRRNHFTVNIDAPNINIWQEIKEKANREDDPDREFDFKYDVTSVSSIPLENDHHRDKAVSTTCHTRTRTL